MDKKHLRKLPEQRKKKEGLKIELTELLNTLGFEKDCRQDSEEIKKGKGKKLLRKNLSCKIEKVMKKKNLTLKNLLADLEKERIKYNSENYRL